MLSRLEGIKVCCDYPERMPSYANLTHSTFVCTSALVSSASCSSYRIKGISISTFSEEEVATLAKGGNSAHNAVFMG